MPTDSIGEGGSYRSNAGDPNKEDAIEHRCMNTDICNFAGASSKEGLFLLWFSIKCHQEGSRYIEALSHCARHGCVEIKGITRQSLDSLAYPLSRKEKDRQ